jgi:hypothetical protein
VLKEARRWNFGAIAPATTTLPLIKAVGKNRIDYLLLAVRTAHQK